MNLLNLVTSKFAGEVVSTKAVLREARAAGIKADLKEISSFHHSKGWFKVPGEKSAVSIPSVLESDDEIASRIESRFRTLEKMTVAASKSIVRSMIVSGPGGLGKTYTIDKIVRKMPEERVGYVKGFVRPSGLFATLFQYRFEGCVIVFDDADSIFDDETALNLLKAACDSSDERIISWLSQRELVDADGESIPQSFEFKGTVIFISNRDFDAEVEKGSKLAPHFEAMISRSHYIDLAIKTPRDYIVRIKQVIAGGMLSNIDANLRHDVVNFIEDNMTKMRELSLRMVLKLAELASIDPEGWREMAKTTCMKG